MARKAAAKKTPKSVETLTHEASKRPNIPTAEYSAMHGGTGEELRLRYSRNPDLDPQLVWRGKDEQDGRDLEVSAPPLYIQEKVHPKALIDDLLRQTREQQHDDGERMADLFADFNGIPKGVDKTAFYQHEQNWTNRMILGDSLQVMASLAEREGLRGKVQCIYFDPPYGIRFNSNFQWSTTSRDVKDGNAAHITREPEQVKAFRDTWRDGIHSYLTYLRDRLTVARDLLTESGSIFVQISEENVHRLRSLMDEVFGAENFIVQIIIKKTGTLVGEFIESINDYILWYGHSKHATKYRKALSLKIAGEVVGYQYLELPDSVVSLSASSDEEREAGRLFGSYPLHSQGFRATTTCDIAWQARSYHPGVNRNWKVASDGLTRTGRAGRILSGANVLRFKRYFDDFPAVNISNNWDETFTATDKVYVVQTSAAAVQRCILMSTDPGDLILDPTCGSGTTATVAEEWGRRWITIDTSRAALALARARIMGARYPFYLLADSREGQLKEAELLQSVPSEQATRGDIRQGFVYERVPHITLKSIANNAERFEEELAPIRVKLSKVIPAGWLAKYRKGQKYTVDVPAEIQEWEIPRERPSEWSAAAAELHARFWELRIARQREIDASIAAKAEHEYLYDKPYQDNKKVRVAGPFTVESVSPHRMVSADDAAALATDSVAERRTGYLAGRDFPSMILENLKVAGVQQAAKGDRITFTSLVPWPGQLICGEGRYQEGSHERRAGIFIGPEFGTVTRPDLVAATREAAESGFDVLVACAFNFEAHTTEFTSIGKVPVLKARMNADLHMADDLRQTDRANLFVVFGEPDIEVIALRGGKIRIHVKGVDVFDPSTGEIRSDDPDGIACWFIDTDYNEESFFVRHAYFLGANDPYKSLKTTLRAEINQEAWESLHSAVSRPFDRPKSGRVAVKVINHLGDEVMKVVRG